jgi:hypothetical protein
MVCKNRGSPFSPEATFFYKNVPNMTSFSDPRGSQKLKNLTKGAEKKLKKKRKKQ